MTDVDQQSDLETYDNKILWFYVYVGNRELVPA